MFLTPQEIAQSRDYTLNNLLGLSSACFAASQRLSELVANHGRDALYSSSKQFTQFGHVQLDTLNQLPTGLWLEHSSRTSKLLGNAYEIVGETQKILIHSAEAQIRALDEITFSSLSRLARNSPWETAIAFKAMHCTLESAEQTLREVSAAAIESVDLAAQEVQQLSEPLNEAAPTKSKPASRSRAQPD